MTNKNEPRNEKDAKPVKRPYQPPRVETEPVFEGLAYCTSSDSGTCGGGALSA